MDNLERYRHCNTLIDIWNDHIKELEKYENMVDLSEQLKVAYAEREKLEQEQERIKEFIKNIPDKRYRVMFYMFYCKNYTKRAIAEYLGVSESFFYRLWNKAEKELKGL
ncbi:DUF1492 domain-containing protein [uncultured Eubacterium sp.]|uniref:DUF1492 domain-containing protein n=1 Tax=uncultured Eubacterium sp. TaxID=165185 RepID=UPI00265D2E5D|nr:DUF1492 domain-containing protein [uncultured Eubacterium sp.]